MRRLSLLLLLLSVLHLTAAHVLAQRQRLAIPPQSFSLTRRGDAHDAKAYCLDRHLIISEPVNFNAVLAGNVRAVRVGDRPPMTLKQAIEQGFVIVKGAGVRDRGYSRIDGTQLKFVSNTDEPVTVNFSQTVAMGEDGSSPVNPALLALVRESVSAEDFRGVQDVVWRTGIDESRLEALGFYGGGRVVRTPATTRMAVQAFQEEQGLPRTGVLNRVTKAALADAEQRQIRGFEEIGFRASRSDTDVESVVDNIRAFERFIGRRDPTGKLTADLRAEARAFANEYGHLVRQALAVDAAGGLPSDPSLLGNTPNVVTFQRDSFSIGDTPLQVSGVLLETPQGFAFLSIVNRGLESRATGEMAITSFDNFSKSLAAIKIDERTLAVRSGIYKPGGKVPLQLGAETVEMSQAQMEQFLAGETGHPQVEAAINKLPAGGTSKPRLVIFRSPFDQGRGGGGGGGGPLGMFGYDRQDPLPLALALERRYGKKVDVFVASDTSRALSNLEMLPKLSRGSQIGLYVDGNFKYSADTVNPIKKDLERAQIRVLKVGDSPASETRIFLFAGHRDEAYEQMVMKLAEQGHFRGGIIAQAVCGSGCDARFNSLLIGKSGARAVIFYNQNINAQAVQDVLLNFTELLSKEGAPNGNYHELWQKSVDAVEKTEAPALRGEVRKLRSILIQLSFGKRRPSPDAE